VLDVDSPQLDRFDAEDEAGLSALAKMIARKL
jgi:putative methionine-R-sulfoxide reductase with GAF domain